VLIKREPPTSQNPQRETRNSQQKNLSRFTAFSATVFNFSKSHKSNKSQLNGRTHRNIGT